MLKISVPDIAATQKRMSIRIPKKMLQAIEADREAAGFNKKQKAQYYSEVINALFEQENYTALIAEEFIEPGTTKNITITLDKALADKINTAVQEVKTKEQQTTDRSSVVRTALTQRLMATIQQGAQANG